MEVIKGRMKRGELISFVIPKISSELEILIWFLEEMKNGIAFLEICL